MVRGASAMGPRDASGNEAHAARAAQNNLPDKRIGTPAGRSAVAADSRPSGIPSEPRLAFEAGAQGRRRGHDGTAAPTNGLRDVNQADGEVPGDGARGHTAGRSRPPTRFISL